MAIPSNYIDKIKKEGESRPICPPADHVRVNNENFEADNLDEVLDQVAEAIDEAADGYNPPADGIPKTDLAPGVQTSLGLADTAYQKPGTGIPATDIAPGVIPDVSGLATKTELYNKVDKVTGKGLSTNDYTTEEKTKLAGIATGAQVNVISGIKAHGASTNLPVTNGVVELPESEAGGLSEADIDVSSNMDGTVGFTFGADTYTINLNHEHENMAKLVVCEESDLPSTLAMDTIYAQVDDAETPTEIQSLWIAGLEFVGGGGEPDDEPRLTSPRSGATIDFAGQSTVTLFVKGKNLTSALSIAVTGDFTVTLNGSTVSSISASDANNGVTLTLTQGSGFFGGTLSISSTGVDTRTCSVEDSEGFVPIRGVKLNGNQWLLTDYIPNANTVLELKFKLTKTTNTVATADRNFMRTAMNGNNSFLIFPDGDVGWTRWGAIINADGTTTVLTSTISEADFFADNAILRFQSGTLTFISNGTDYQVGSGISVPTLNAPISICGRITSQGIEKIYNYSDVNIYEFKIWESGTLTKHYKPATHQGVVGLYDVVNNDFISSESSTSLIALES